MTAEDAKTFGLIDDVVSSRPETEEDAKAIEADKPEDGDEG